MEMNGRTLTIETGRVARQAGGAAWISYGDTVMLVTICMGNQLKQTDFFPLSVEYREKFFAVGKIPGGFFKRMVDRIRLALGELYKRTIDTVVGFGRDKT